MGVLPGNEGMGYLVVTLKNNSLFFPELLNLVMIVWGLSFLVEDFLERGKVGLGPPDILKGGT